MLKVNDLILLASEYIKTLNSLNNPLSRTYIEAIKGTHSNLLKLQEAHTKITKILSDYKEIVEKQWAKEVGFQKIEFMQPLLEDIKAQIEQGNLNEAQKLASSLHEKFEEKFPGQYHKTAKSYRSVEKVNEALEKLDNMNLEEIDKQFLCIFNMGVCTIALNELCKNILLEKLTCTAEEQAQIDVKYYKQLADQVAVTTDFNRMAQRLGIDLQVDLNQSEQLLAQITQSVPEQPQTLAREQLANIPTHSAWQLIPLPGQNIMVKEPIAPDSMRMILNSIQADLSPVIRNSQTLSIIQKEILEHGAHLWNSLHQKLTSLEGAQSTSALVTQLPQLQQEFTQFINFYYCIKILTNPNLSDVQKMHLIFSTARVGTNPLLSYLETNPSLVQQSLDKNNFAISSTATRWLKDDSEHLVPQPDLLARMFANHSLVDIFIHTGQRLTAEQMILFSRTDVNKQTLAQESSRVYNLPSTHMMKREEDGNTFRELPNKIEVAKKINQMAKASGMTLQVDFTKTPILANILHMIERTIPQFGLDESSWQHIGPISKKILSHGLKIYESLKQYSLEHNEQPGTEVVSSQYPSINTALEELIQIARFLPILSNTRLSDEEKLQQISQAREVERDRPLSQNLIRSLSHTIPNNIATIPQVISSATMNGQLIEEGVNRSSMTNALTSKKAQKKQLQKQTEDTLKRCEQLKTEIQQRDLQSIELSTQIKQFHQHPDSLKIQQAIRADIQPPHVVNSQKQQLKYLEEKSQELNEKINTLQSGRSVNKNKNLFYLSSQLEEVLKDIIDLKNKEVFQKLDNLRFKQNALEKLQQQDTSSSLALSQPIDTQQLIENYLFLAWFNQQKTKQESEIVIDDLNMGGIDQIKLSNQFMQQLLSLFFLHPTRQNGPSAKPKFPWSSTLEIQLRTVQNLISAFQRETLQNLDQPINLSEEQHQSSPAEATTIAPWAQPIPYQGLQFSVADPTNISQNRLPYVFMRNTLNFIQQAGLHITANDGKIKSSISPEFVDFFNILTKEASKLYHSVHNQLSQLENPKQSNTDLPPFPPAKIQQEFVKLIELSSLILSFINPNPQQSVKKASFRPLISSSDNPILMVRQNKHLGIDSHQQIPSYILGSLPLLEIFLRSGKQRFNDTELGLLLSSFIINDPPSTNFKNEQPHLPSIDEMNAELQQIQTLRNESSEHLEKANTALADNINFVLHIRLFPKLSEQFSEQLSLMLKTSQKEFDFHNEKIQKLTVELLEIKQNIHRLDVSPDERKKSEYHREFHQKYQELIQLEQEFNQCIQAETVKIQSLSQEFVETLRKQISALNEKNQSLSTENQQLSTELLELEFRLKEIETQENEHIPRLEESFNEINEENQRLYAALESVNQQLSELKIQALKDSRVEPAPADQPEEFATKIQQLSTENKSLREQFNGLSDQFKIEANQLLHLLKVTQQKTNKLLERLDKFSSLEGSYSEEEDSQLQGIDGALTDIQTKIDELSKQQGLLVAEISSACKILNMGGIYQLHQQNLQILNELVSLEKNYQDLLSDKLIVLHEIESSVSQSSRLEEELPEIDENSDEFRDLDEKVNFAYNSLCAIQQENLSLCQTRNHFLKMAREKLNENSDLQLSHDYDSIDQQISTFENEINRLKEVLKEQTQKMQALPSESAAKAHLYTEYCNTADYLLQQETQINQLLQQQIKVINSYLGEEMQEEEDEPLFEVNSGSQTRQHQARHSTNSTQTFFSPVSSALPVKDHDWQLYAALEQPETLPTLQGFQGVDPINLKTQTDTAFASPQGKTVFVPTTGHPYQFHYEKGDAPRATLLEKDAGNPRDVNYQHDLALDVINMMDNILSKGPTLYLDTKDCYIADIAYLYVEYLKGQGLNVDAHITHKGQPLQNSSQESFDILEKIKKYPFIANVQNSAWFKEAKTHSQVAQASFGLDL